MSAESMAQPLSSTYLDPSELLVREAVQNSVDEQVSKDHPVHIKIKAKKLLGAKKNKFVEGLKFAEIAKIEPFFPYAHNWFKKGKASLSNLNNPEIPLRIIEISDHNANGLGGRWNLGRSINDRFFNLVLSITKSKKQEETDSNPIGSYGFGKMVFALSSNLRTMLYYSHFQETPETQGAEKRLMATAFLPAHYRGEEVEYTGHAYFGLDSGEENNPKKPLENDAADEFYELIGLEPREKGDFGTSVVLPECEFSVTELGGAIEKWWWPLITDKNMTNRISFQLVEDDGSEINLVPQKREDLYPFIQASNNSRENFSDADQTATSQAVKIIHQGKSKSPGKLSCLKLSTGSNNELKNCVAIIRDGMVIEYSDRAFREEGPEAVGVFLVTTNPDLRNYIIFSEPPAHDTILEKQDRLVNIFGQPGSDFIRQTQNQLREKSRDFQTTLAQIKKTPGEGVLSFLDEILGPLIKPRKKGFAKTPSPEARVQTIGKSARTVVINGDHFSELNFELGLSNDADFESMECNLKLSCSVLRDENETLDRHLNVNLSLDVSGQTELLGPGETKTILLEKGAKIRGYARSQIHPSWIIRWGVMLDRSEAET